MSVGLTSHDWVMVLDSDEIVHPNLGRRLREIAETGEADVVRIPRRNVILGREMAHGQWWPNAKRRFFHKDHIDIRVEMHGGFHAAAGAREIMLPMDRDCCLWHFSYHDVADLVWKSQRYTTVQAWQRARSGRRPGASTLVHRRRAPGVEGVRQGPGMARRRRPASRPRRSASSTGSSSRPSSGTSWPRTTGRPSTSA